MALASPPIPLTSLTILRRYIQSSRTHKHAEPLGSHSNTSYISYSLPDLIYKAVPHTHTHIQGAAHPSNSSYISYDSTDLLYEALPHTQLKGPAHLSNSSNISYNFTDIYTKLYHTPTYVCLTHPQIVLTSLTILPTYIRSCNTHTNMPRLPPLP